MILQLILNRKLTFFSANNQFGSANIEQLKGQR